MDSDRIRAYDERAPTPGETATATFALGCFWGPDAAFGAREGVVRTRVGYAGGSTPDPTYHDVGDHSEAVQVEYDPDVVSFADLVEMAVEGHDPRRQPDRRQYQHVLFYGSPDERATVEDALDALAFGVGDDGVADAEVATRVEPLESFTVAETYHQRTRKENTSC